MNELHDITKDAAAIIQAASFEVIPKFKNVDGFYILDDITIYFKDSNLASLHSLTFTSASKAMEGMEGFIQLYKNVA